MSGVPQLAWAQADHQAISIDAQRDVWHAGIVKDILATPAGNVIVATDSGGIWSVGETGSGLCVLDSDKPDMWCLAQGPDGDDHVFAGGQTLFETDVSEAAPLLSWNEVTVNDASGNSVGTINGVVVDRGSRRIVLATANGVYWATIPSASGSGGCAGCLPALFGGGGTNAPRPAYAWIAARGLPPGQFASVAFGPLAGNLPTVVAAAWGSNTATGLYGLFSGGWDSNGNLVFRRSNISNLDATQMCFTRVRSCAQFPARLYASASNGAGNLYALLTSIDGGGDWVVLPGIIQNDPKGVESIYTYCTGQGNDGGRPCNALGVGPISPGFVALGWRAGPFFSSDGGASFAYIAGGFDPNPGDGSKYAHLHGDFHAMHFDVNDPNGFRLFMGSDGGIVRTDDAGGSFVSIYNRQLLNLQLLGTTAAREWYGSFGASPTAPGLVASGTQDNGNLFSVLDANPQVWTYFEGGDGNLTTFTMNGALVHFSNSDFVAQLSVWDGTTLRSRGEIPYYQDRTIAAPIFERVEAPSYRNGNGQLMYGVGGTGEFVYGLFGDPNGDNTAWSYLGSVPIDLNSISAVSSRDGNVVFVGSLGARLFRLQPPDVFPAELPNTAISNPQGDTNYIINRIVVADAANAFASFNKTDGSTGSVLRWDGNVWAPVPSGFPSAFIYAMEIDVTNDPPIVYIATDAKVYGSADFGTSWVDVSGGLPRRAHCSDMRFYQDQTGEYLYLSTFGRSLWVTTLVTFIRGRPR